MENRVGGARAHAGAPGGEGVEVRVGFSGLAEAAVEVLTKTAAAESACRELDSLRLQVRGIWDSEAELQLDEQLRENLEELNTLLTGFRGHARNLQTIAGNYVRSGGEISSLIGGGLSTEVIV